MAIAQCGAVTVIPVTPQAKVIFVVIVPAERTKAEQDLLPSQNFRQPPLQGTRLELPSTS
jgi:hypothetical protein